MAKCKHCGAELPDGAKVCFLCKFEVDETPVETTTTSTFIEPIRNNRIANVIRIIGWIIIVLGLVAGIGVFVYYTAFIKVRYAFLYSLLYGIAVIWCAIVNGFLFLGLSEIIRLLQNIDNKTK